MLLILRFYPYSIDQNKYSSFYVFYLDKLGLGSASAYLKVTPTVWVWVLPKTTEYVEWVLLKLSYKYTLAVGDMSSISFWTSRSFIETFCLVLTVHKAWRTLNRLKKFKGYTESSCLLQKGSCIHYKRGVLFWVSGMAHCL